jgi:putative hydrolase
MRIIADMHTHTIASGHAYSTVMEIATAAARAGLAAVAITDHGPALPGAPHYYHFAAMRFIPTYLEGVRIFRGIEANILDRSGRLDFPDGASWPIEFVMAGFHEACGYDDCGETANTDTLIAVMENPRVRAISHPGNPLFTVDLLEIAKASRRTGTALEINNSSFGQSRSGSPPRCAKLARLMAEQGSLVVVGSDAHLALAVGDFAKAVAVMEAAGISEEQVVNSSFPRLLSFLDLEA